MIYLGDITKTTCVVCGVKYQEGDHLSGPNMWFSHDPTCGHDVFFTCPKRDCYKTAVKCAECGCEDFYT